jgi:hypothetical protein
LTKLLQKEIKYSQFQNITYKKPNLKLIIINNPAIKLETSYHRAPMSLTIAYARYALYVYVHNKLTWRFTIYNCSIIIQIILITY